MAAAVQQKRPLVLLHKCTECATFALADLPIAEKKSIAIMDIDRIRLKFSQVLGFKEEEEKENNKNKNEASDDEEADSAYTSGHSSGQTSPDESPVSRSDSPSPVDHQKLRVDHDQSVQLLSPSRPQNAFRYRSMSENGENLQLKGILKRRQPILRSLSQCEDGKVDSSTTTDPSSSPPPISPNSRQIRKGSSESQSATNTDDDQISTTACSESENEFGTSPRDRSQSIKKTVRFNDRVQENLFRPNSSILGQRKKNQRKSQRKRRRTNSGDSQTGESTEEHEEEMDAEEIDRDQDADHTDRSDSIDDKQHQPQQQPRSKSNRKKLQRQQQAASILGNDTKYDGFVIGDGGSSDDQKSAVRKLDPRRHSSGDSGMGDDEGESFTPVVQQQSAAKKKNNRNRHRRRTVSCGDSGLDE